MRASGAMRRPKTVARAAVKAFDAAGGRPKDRLSSGGPNRLPIDNKRTVAHRQPHRFAVLHHPGEDLLGKRILHMFLDHALQGPRAVGRIIAEVGEPGARRFVELDGDLPLAQELLQTRHLDIDDLPHVFALQAMEYDY